MSDPQTPYCPSLPSSTDALRAVNGEPEAWLLVVRDILFRAGLIYTGAFVYDRVFRGLPETQLSFKQAIAGSTAIETFVITWIWARKP